MGGGVISLKWVLANDSLDKINKGEVVINANTVFNGDATIVSKGKDETTVIEGGQITFTRKGLPLTVIKNVKIGNIRTDGNGKGKIKFEGFKNLNILTSIKSFNLTKNVRSIDSYAKLIDPNTNEYAFYLYGKESSVSKPIIYNKNFQDGTTKMTFDLPYISFNTLNLNINCKGAGGDAFVNVLVGLGTVTFNYAKFNFKLTIKRLNNKGNVTLLSSYYTIPVDRSCMSFRGVGGDRVIVYLNSFSVSQELNINDVLDTLEQNTVTIEISDIYLELNINTANPNDTSYKISQFDTSIIQGGDGYEHLNRGYHLYMTDYSKIQLSYSVEELINIVGEGDLQYIAMEI